MFKQIVFVGLLALVGAAQATEIRDLSFLSGCWRGEDAESTNEECWGSADGDMLLGTAKTVVGGKAVSFEFMKIAETAGRVVFTPYVNGAEAVSFPLLQASDSSIAFENLAHDFPRRIEYQRAGDVLSIALSGVDEAGAAMEIKYQLKRR